LVIYEGKGGLWGEGAKPPLLNLSLLKERGIKGMRKIV